MNVQRSALLRVLVLVTLLATPACGMLRVDVVGDAMSPTLRNGESALATKRIDSLTRGDIVGFRYPRDETKSFVMRVIGLPGETVTSAAGRVSVDEKMLSEPYVVEANRSVDTWGPVRVPDGQYFVMGDNRTNSSDSRHWGLVRRDSIWAKVIDR